MPHPLLFTTLAGVGLALSGCAVYDDGYYGYPSSGYGYVAPPVVVSGTIYAPGVYRDYRAPYYHRAYPRFYPRSSAYFHWRDGGYRSHYGGGHHSGHWRSGSGHHGGSGHNSRSRHR